MNLPNKIIPLRNQDKGFHERWSSDRNLLNIPHPFRTVCVGRPNCGKSTVIENMLIRADPMFDEIY